MGAPLFAVLGSGFGLYGYLPALIQNGERVVLPERYREALLARPELAGLASAPTWARDEEAALAAADSAVIALRPADQVRWIDACAAMPHIKNLLLEKPLAPTPDIADRALDTLEHAGKNFRIGYTLRLTPWARALREALRGPEVGTLAIDWTFMAHHYRHDVANWKRNHAEGGGAIRFYGIHLIALLAEYGYRNVEYSRAAARDSGECEAWTAGFNGPDRPTCTVRVDSRNATSRFEIALSPAPPGGRPIFSANDPFDAPPSQPALDRRARVMAHQFHDLAARDDARMGLYREINRLWREVENTTRFTRDP